MVKKKCQDYIDRYAFELALLASGESVIYNI
jgi:hypothetical protein